MVSPGLGLVYTDICVYVGGPFDLVLCAAVKNVEAMLNEHVDSRLTRLRLCTDGSEVTCLY